MRNRLLVVALACGVLGPVPLSTVARQAPADSQPTVKAIPPNATQAAEVLAKSPRHGEWADIALPGSETRLKTWVVYPERAEKAAVVLVIHEIFGLTDWVRGVADQLAADGFIALAPDLLSGMGPNGGGTDALGDAVRETIRTLTPDQIAARLDAVRNYALGLPAASDKSACIGFCWGGSASFNYAARQPELDAAVVYYGTAPMVENAPDRVTLEKIKCPVLGCYGGDDARVTTTVEPTAEVMRDLKKSFTSQVYDKAGHGFLRQSESSQRDGANLAAAQRAWQATIEFLRTHAP